MTFEVIGTRHLGQVRCICPENPQGCPLHQHVEKIEVDGVEAEDDDA